MAMKPYAQMSHLGLAVYDFDKMLEAMHARNKRQGHKVGTNE